MSLNHGRQMLCLLTTSHLGTFATTIWLSVGVGRNPRRQLWHFHVPTPPIVTGWLCHNRLLINESCSIYSTRLLYQSLNTVADFAIYSMLPLLGGYRYVQCQFAHLLKTAAIAAHSFVLELLCLKHRVPMLRGLVFH